MQAPKGINILITGTPGTGKTALAQMIASDMQPPFEHIEVGKVIKEHEFYSQHDPEFDTQILEEDDEDRLLDYLEPILVNQGNHVVDFHSSELFPERWFHLVVVLHTSTSVLFDRLTARGYNAKKRDENMEAEIQCVCEEEAREAYKNKIVLVLENDTLEQMVNNYTAISECVADIYEGMQEEQQQQ